MVSNKQVSIQNILKELRSKGYTPKEVRYIFKEIRIKGKYQVPLQKRKLPDFLNDVEIDYLFNKSLNKDKTTRMLVYMGIFTGLRISEQNKLLIENIDFESRQLKVVSGKGGKDRYVPLTTELASKIKDYIGERKKGYLFVKKNGVAYTKRALQKKVENILRECHFAKKLSTHSLRHTFATLCRRRGISLQDIQVLMGHSSIKVTEIYAHIELGETKSQFIKMIGYGG